MLHGVNSSAAIRVPFRRTGWVRKTNSDQNTNIISDNSYVCRGLIRVNVAVAASAVVDTIVAVSYLVSIASFFSKPTVNDRISTTQLTLQSCVSIFSFIAVLLLSLGVLMKSPWLLIFHMAKSVLMSSIFSLKTVLDAYDMLQKGFSMYDGVVTGFTGLYAITQIWFFLVVKIVYRRMITPELYVNQNSGRAIMEDETEMNTAPKPIYPVRPHQSNRLAIAQVAPRQKYEQNCDYEVPIHAEMAGREIEENTSEEEAGKLVTKVDMALGIQKDDAITPSDKKGNRPLSLSRSL